MKRILVLCSSRLGSTFIVSVFLIISAGYIFACNKDKKDTIKEYSAKEGRYIVNDTEYVLIQLLPESGLINSTAEIILENHTNGVLTYGNEFSLEYFDNENWTELQLDINFTSIGIQLMAGETRKGSFNLSMFEEYNKGKKGRYRYVRKFGLVYESSSEEDNKRVVLYVEFEIK